MQLRDEWMVKTQERIAFRHYRALLVFLQCDKWIRTAHLSDKLFVHGLHGEVLFRVFLLRKENLRMIGDEWTHFGVGPFAQLFTENEAIHANLLHVHVCIEAITFVAELI